MSFDLTTPALAARNVDLGGGLVATLRPWTGLLESAAETAVAAEAETFLRGKSAPEAWGAELTLEDLQDPAIFAGLWRLIETATRASFRIARLNLVLEDERRFPPNRQMLARLFTRGLDGDGAVHLNAYLAAEAACLRT